MGRVGENLAVLLLLPLSVVNGRRRLLLKFFALFAASILVDMPVVIPRDELGLQCLLYCGKARHEVLGRTGTETIPLVDRHFLVMCQGEFSLGEAAVFICGCLSQPVIPQAKDTFENAHSLLCDTFAWSLASIDAAHPELLAYIRDQFTRVKYTHTYTFKVLLHCIYRMKCKKGSLYDALQDEPAMLGGQPHFEGRPRPASVLLAGSRCNCLFCHRELAEGEAFCNSACERNDQRFRTLRGSMLNGLARSFTKQDCHGAYLLPPTRTDQIVDGLVPRHPSDQGLARCSFCSRPAPQQIGNFGHWFCDVECERRHCVYDVLNGMKATGRGYVAPTRTGAFLSNAPSSSLGYESRHQASLPPNVDMEPCSGDGSGWASGLEPPTTANNCGDTRSMPDSMPNPVQSSRT